MAQFCTKCGAPMGDGMTFCTSCGAAAAAPPAPVEQAAPPPPPPVPVADVPLQPGAPVAAPPPKKGSPVVKILLVIVGVIILVTLLAAASCAYMFYRGKQKLRQFKDQMESSMPSHGGTHEVFPYPSSPQENPSENPTAGGGSSVDMGDLAYPGAQLGEGHDQSIFGSAGIKMQEYLTSDSLDTVVAYYKNKLGNNSMFTESGGTAVFQVSGTGGLTTISISPDSSSGKTKITVSSIGKH